MPYTKQSTQGMCHTQSNVRKGCAVHKAKNARDVPYTKQSMQVMCHTQSKVRKGCAIHKANYARDVPYKKQSTQGMCHAQSKVRKGCATLKTKYVKKFPYAGQNMYKETQDKLRNTSATRITNYALLSPWTTNTRAIWLERRILVLCSPQQAEVKRAFHRANKAPTGMSESCKNWNVNWI